MSNLRRHTVNLAASGEPQKLVASDLTQDLYERAAIVRSTTGISISQMVREGLELWLLREQTRGSNGEP